MKRSILFLTVLSGCFLAVRGQGDTLADMRRFIRVCNVYKQLPVALDVLVERRANLITGTSDSSRTSALFCLHSDGSYVEMDGMEQLVNDSLLLLVNKPSKRMILYANHQSVAGRFREYLGMQVADSSVGRMGRKYTASMPGSAGDTAVLEVRSRASLTQTNLPREEVRVRFHAHSDEPYEVVQLQRSLVPVAREIYEKARVLPEWTGRTVAVGAGKSAAAGAGKTAAGDSLYFLVKEQTVFFRYRRISHDPGERLPFRMSDRIAAEMPGKYQPVAGFADYVLTQQF